MEWSGVLAKNVLADIQADDILKFQWDVGGAVGGCLNTHISKQVLQQNPCVPIANTRTNKDISNDISADDILELQLNSGGNFWRSYAGGNVEVSY